MKPRLLIALLASIASISTASILFLDGSSRPQTKGAGGQTAIEIKWGEGSEAGVPEAAITQNINAEPIRDEETYVFAGKCANGESYRFVSYQKNTAGARHSYYDFSGPAGTGTVESEAAPKVMAVRICRKAAEIISANYWESH